MEIEREREKTVNGAPPNIDPKSSGPSSTAQEQQRQSDIAAAESYQSLWAIVWRQFLEHRMAVAGLFVIAIFILVALSAPLIQKVTGIDPMSQNPLNRYLPPMSTVVASSGQRETLVTQFAESHPEQMAALNAEILDKKLVESMTPEDAIYDLFAQEIADIRSEVAQLTSPGAQDLQKLVAGLETFHVFGTDELGRDVFMRLVYGTRVSIGVGILVALASALLGLLIGSIAGFYGGWVDIILMRITDSLISLPSLPILIVVSAISIEKLVELVPFLGFFMSPSNQSIVKLVFVLVIFSWMTVARLVRASVLSLKEREFIMAAKTLGATDRRVIVRHLFPNVVAPLLVSVTLGVGGSIQAEAALSFLGLGIQQPTPSWGNMLFNALEIMLESPVLVVIPGLLILLTTISFNYLGDGLQDAIDPKALKTK